jgi:hypothetical protein
MQIVNVVALEIEEFSKLAAIDATLYFLEHRIEAKHMTAHRLDALCRRATRSFDNAPTTFEIIRQRLLAKKMLTKVQRRHRRLDMQLIRRVQGDKIECLSLEHLTEIRVNALHTMLIRYSTGARFVHIANRNEIHRRDVFVRTRECGSVLADTNLADANFTGLTHAFSRQP